jgi:hypothetical protein
MSRPSELSLNREKQIYELFVSGKQYKNIVIIIGDTMTESGVKQALARYRKRNNLPNGRKAGGD